MENKTQLYAEHLSGMVKFPTVSYVDESKVNYDDFYALHEYLEKTYPLVHATLEKKVIGKASLLYKWRSKNPTPGKKPVLLSAHQDVVPELDHSKWSHEPYSGDIDGTFVWGRGSGDCKSTILCEMEAITALIESGFEADYDIYLAFGHNEEIMVPDDRKGAKLIAKYLEEQGITLGAVFDEGGGPTKTDKGYSVNLFLGEKGFYDFEIYCDTKGGHSMMPGKGTGLGKVAKAVVALEEHPFPYRLTPLTTESFKASSVNFEGRKREVFADPEKYFDELVKYADTDLFLDAKLHTTAAVTMAQGSSASNILPMHASVTVNLRVLQGDTGDSCEAYLKSLCPEGVNVRRINGEGPYPDGIAGGRVYELVCRIEKDRCGENTVIVPNLIPGGTDAKSYAGICDSVYRYTGVMSTGFGGGAHGIDEFFDVASAQSSIDFYTEFLHRY